MTTVVIYDNIGLAMAETRKTRPVSWIKAALKDFDEFPEGAKSVLLGALTIAAEGGKADIAKPLHGFGSGMLGSPWHTAVMPFAWSMPSNLRMRFGLSTHSRRNRSRASRRRNTRSTW